MAPRVPSSNLPTLLSSSSSSPTTPVEETDQSQFQHGHEIKNPPTSSDRARDGAAAATVHHQPQRSTSPYVPATSTAATQNQNAALPSQPQPIEEYNHVSLYGPSSSANAMNPNYNLYNNGMSSSPYGMMGSMSSPYNSYGYGMGGGGLGMMSMMGGGYGVMGPLWLSNLNQFLLGVQTVIFSLGQAIQIVGMNTNAIQHLFESITAMFDHAVATFHEMQRLEHASRQLESDEDKKRRRRLKALRWTMVTAATYAGYRLIKRLLFQNQHRRNQLLPYQAPAYPYSASSSNPYHHPQSAYSYPPPTGAYPYY